MRRLLSLLPVRVINWSITSSQIGDGVNEHLRAISDHILHEKGHLKNK
ncbi:unnamed protein product [Brassica oleracea var. botrytis]